MGLDTVELVLEIEQAFEISIPDQEAERIRTVGELTEYVWRKVGPPQNEDACPTSRAFFQLRRALIPLTGASRRNIRPRSRTDAFFPPATRLKQWRALRKALPGLPDLDFGDAALTRYQRAILAGGAVGAALGLGTGAFSVPTAFLGTILGGVIGVMCAHALADPFLQASERFIPAECATLRGMARMLAASGPNPRTRELVELRVRRIVADFLGAKLEEVRPESRFVEDLGAD